MNLEKSNHTSDQSIGCLFIRKNIVNPKVQDLFQALYLHLLEASIMLKSIQLFKNINLEYFEAVVGDRKCQIRTSMFIDLIDNKTTACQDFEQEKILIQDLVIKVNEQIKYISNLNQIQLKLFTQQLKNNGIPHYFQQYQLNFHPSSNLKLISLSHLTSLSIEELSSLATNLSLRKIKQALNHGAKSTFCELSIDYENYIASLYGSHNEQKSLSQIEEKGFCKMTSVFTSFKPILKKMIQKKQSILQKTIIFCKCSGIKTTSFTLFKPYNSQFIKEPINPTSNDITMVIEGYQFPGSFCELQSLLHFPINGTLIPKDFHKPCECINPSIALSISCIEETILSNFAYHPQFTNDCDIDFKNLALLGSDLHQEYIYFKSLPGYSMNDMSKFFAHHVYPSTIKEALQ